MKWFNLKRQRGCQASSKRTGAAHRRLGSPFTRRLRFEPMEQRRLLSVTIYDFDDLQDMDTDLDEIYYLGADIDASGENFEPVGDSSTPFEGEFYGAGYTISDLTIDTSSDAYVGLFGYTSGATLDEVALVNVDIDADLTSNLYVGGIVGYSSNTGITDSYVTGRLTAETTTAGNVYAGGLVGYVNDTADKTISGSYADCDVDVTDSASLGYAGGLIGYVYVYGSDFAVVDSYAMGDVTANISSTIYAGGLVGYASAIGSSAANFTLSQSFATGDVDADSTSGNAEAGGLVGHTTIAGIPTAAAGSIEDSYATGTVTATADGTARVGGLVGFSFVVGNGASSITNTYAAGNATASASTTAFAGGLVAHSLGTVITNSFATGVADAKDATTNVEGGFAGAHSSGTITNGWYNAANMNGLGSGSGDVTPETPLSDFYDADHDVYDTDAPNWDFEAPAGWIEFSGTYPRLAYEWSTSITSVLQLQNMQLDLDATYTLANDIDASQTAGWNWDSGDSEHRGFDPIGTFTGSFDGSGYAISDLRINADAETYVGLFGYTSGATLNEVALVKADIDADHTSNFYAGGVVGYSTNTDITDSYVTGKLTAASTSSVTAYAGGLVGYVNGTANTTISGSYTDCDVDVSGSVSSAIAGGLAGFIDAYEADVLVVDSYAMGDVTADASQFTYAGGLVGYASAWGSSASSVTLSQSFATGAVDGDATTYDTFAGGLVGIMMSSNSSAAVVEGSIEDSYASGTVTATAGRSAVAGGLMGFDAALGSNVATYITNTYATGSATASGVTAAYAGGLIAYNIGVSSGVADIDNSYATGVADAKDATTNIEGGFAGYHAGGTITNCWWYNTTNTSGLGSGSGDVTKASAASDFYDKTQDVYDTDAPNWDFTAPADWDEFSDTYPHLAYEWETSITTLLQLQNMQLDLDATYTLANHIDASQTAGWNWDSGDSEHRGFDPVGDIGNYFGGTFDGAGYTISNLTLTPDNEAYVGLFGYVYPGGTLDNVVLENVTIDADYDDNIYVGGVVGYGDSFDITDSSVSGNITVDTTGGLACVGGLVGYYGASGSSSLVDKSSAETDITVTGPSAIAGGLMGAMYMVENLNGATATVSESFAVGSVYAEATSTTAYAGGLIGDFRADNDEDTSTTSISAVLKDSYATGDSDEVVATGISYAYAGGLVGIVRAFADESADDATADVYIDNTYSTLPATALTTGGGTTYPRAGGLVGVYYEQNNDANITVSDSFATGLADASGDVNSYEGGFAGYNGGASHTNCYWTSANGSAVGSGSSTGISSTTNATLLAVVSNDYTHAVFDNWDFSGRSDDGTDDIWDVEGNELLPTLSWE